MVVGGPLILTYKSDEESCANDGEHTKNNKQCQGANYLLNKFLSASAWSSL